MVPDKTYFDKKYSSNKFKFKFDYDSDILRDIVKYKKYGKVLDLGCGEGGLSLALAEKGFEVTCIDISKIAINKIKSEAKKRGLVLRAIALDLDDYDLDEDYDIIICCGILQFFGENGKKKLKQIREHTREKGINVIDAFVNRWTSKEDFRNIYSDWKVLEKDKYRNKKLDGKTWKLVYLVVGNT